MLRSGLFHTTRLIPPKLGMANSVVSASFTVLKGSDTVVLSIGELNHGYQVLHGRVQELIQQATMFAVVSPGLSMGWLALTSQMLLESPVAMSLLGVGGVLASNRMMQIMRVNEYAELSVKTNPGISSLNMDENQRISQIIAGNNAQVKFITSGLQVSGPVSDKTMSVKTGDATQRFHAMPRVVLPTCVLTDKADKLVESTHARWLSRLSVPFSILNLLTVLFKDPEDRTADDYVVSASSAYNLFDYFDGPSVAEAREKLTQALMDECKTPEDVIRFFVDRKLLDAGGMSFLLEWSKNQQSIGVRVARTGAAILYQNPKSSFGGPFPITIFAKQSDSKAKLPESECEEITDGRGNKKTH